MPLVSTASASAARYAPVARVKRDSSRPLFSPFVPLSRSSLPRVVPSLFLSRSLCLYVSLSAAWSGGRLGVRHSVTPPSVPLSVRSSGGLAGSLAVCLPLSLSLSPSPQRRAAPKLDYSAAARNCCKSAETSLRTLRPSCQRDTDGCSSTTRKSV